MGKKIDTKVEKKVANWEHWKFSITDMDDAGKLALDLLPGIKRNELVEIKAGELKPPILAVKLSDFRAFALNDDDVYEKVQEWGDLYVTIAGKGTVQFKLELDPADVFLSNDAGTGRAGEHRLIEFSAHIVMTDGTTIEVDPIIDERPT